MVSLKAAAAGGGIVEGDYNTWTALWGWVLPGGVASYPPNPAIFIDEVNDIFYLWWYADSPSKKQFGAFNIADHSTIFQSPSGSHYTYDAPYVGGAGDYTFSHECHYLDYSMLCSNQTYILLARYPYGSVEVWRAGALLWSRTLSDDWGGTPSHAQALFSPTGKYIMIVEEYDKLWLYEGSKV